VLLQATHPVLQFLVLSQHLLDPVDLLQSPELCHLSLKVLNQLLVAPPDILLRYPVILPFLGPLLLRQVANTPRACSDKFLGLATIGSNRTSPHYNDGTMVVPMYRPLTFSFAFGWFRHLLMARLR
jgi:hypothetical protein